MQQNNPDDLLLEESETTKLVVPYFMRRPYGVMLFVKDDSKQFIHELTAQEKHDVASGIAKVTKIYHSLLPSIGRDIAYNVLFHTGPGAGIYIEFLPYTQETGGMEQQGLWVCQDTPQGSANVLKTYFK